MEKILRQTYLFDFYSELLTQHQRDIYEEVVCNDTSFSEVAQREGVSRQSIHELVRKCERQLDAYEEKLHMMERFLAVKEHVGLIRKEAEGLRSDESMDPRRAGETIRGLCDRILEEL